MTYTPRRDIPGKLSRYASFDGSSMHAKFYPPNWRDSHFDAGIGNEAPPKGSIYVIWSYGTPIAWIDPLGKAYKVRQKFSRTTSCHQGMLYALTDLSAAQREAWCITNFVIPEYFDIRDVA